MYLQLFTYKDFKNACVGQNSFRASVTNSLMEELKGNKVDFKVIRKLNHAQTVIEIYA